VNVENHVTLHYLLPMIDCKNVKNVAAIFEAAELDQKHVVHLDWQHSREYRLSTVLPSHK